MDKSQDLLTLKILSRERLIFEGTVSGITCKNKKGVFDILPKHENFISLIFDSLLIHQKDRTTKIISMDQGVLKVVENMVEVYLIESVSTNIN